jgi:hypothetical protein
MDEFSARRVKAVRLAIDDATSSDYWSGNAGDNPALASFSNIGRVFVRGTYFMEF